jgi:hypothetical protein
VIRLFGEFRWVSNPQGIVGAQSFNVDQAPLTLAKVRGTPCAFVVFDNASGKSTANSSSLSCAPLRRGDGSNGHEEALDVDRQRRPLARGGILRKPRCPLSVHSGEVFSVAKNKCCTDYLFH